MLSVLRVEELAYPEKNRGLCTLYLLQADQGPARDQVKDVRKEEEQRRPFTDLQWVEKEQ